MELSSTLLPSKFQVEEFSIKLTKPLGMLLEENSNGRGVFVEDLVEGGAAEQSGAIQHGDSLLRVMSSDVTELEFDSVMELLQVQVTTLARMFSKP